MVLAEVEGFEEYLKHWLLLVNAMHLLMKDEITEAELTVAHNLLMQFVQQTEGLYGKQAMTFNVHQLRHLCQSVRDWGPLWCHSGYVFESGNGKIVKMVHAGNGVLSQICRNLSIRESIRIMKKYLPDFEHSKTGQFCQRLESKVTGKSYKVHDNRYFEINPTIRREFFNQVDARKQDCRAFNKLLKNNLVFKTCKRILERSNDTFAITSNNIFIQIVQFVVNKRNHEEFTLYKRVEVEDSSQGISSLKSLVRIEDQIKVIETYKINRLCVLMQKDNEEFLSIVPYTRKFS